MNLIVLVVIGVVIGGLARQSLLRGAPGGWTLCFMLGTAGSMFTAFLVQTFAGRMAGGPASTVIAAILGAALLLLAYRLDLSRRKGGTTVQAWKLHR